jgi:hypothetical protein
VRTDNAEEARGFLCAQQARRQVRVAADGHEITSGSSVDAAAENGGGLWRTMARDRRRVACRICAYALAAPPCGSVGKLKRREISAAQCLIAD